MRVGLVGLGSIGRRHLANLIALGADVTAMDVSAEAVANARQAHPHARYGDSLSFSGLDALVIASPWDTHLAWVEEAVARRLPFLVEKPLGTIEQLPRWRELAGLDLPVNLVGYQLRFHPAFQALRAFLPQPTAGQFFLECDMRTWPGRAYGPLLLEASHEIDLALACGAPTTVDVGGIEEQEITAWLGPWLVSIKGDAERYHRQWTLTRRGCESSLFFFAPEQLGTHMYHLEVAHFLACVQDERPTVCPLAEGLKTLEVCRQIQELAAK
jgi:predicted dehydrogenase